MKTLAIDLDSVLADTMLIWIQEYNKRKKADILKSDIVSWDISQVFDITVEEISQIFTDLWQRHWRNIPQLNQI